MILNYVSMQFSYSYPFYTWSGKADIILVPAIIPMQKNMDYVVGVLTLY
jgi:hypothetical protein